MEQLVLNWKGPYDMTQWPPNELRGAKGISAVVHATKIILIGKSTSKGILSEAKYRKGCIRGLKVIGVIKPDTPDKESGEYAWHHCLRYAGMVPLDQLALLDKAENLLIYKTKPPGNIRLVKQYRHGPEPFKVVNSGDRPPGLPPEVSYPDP